VLDATFKKFVAMVFSISFFLYFFGVENPTESIRTQEIVTDRYSPTFEGCCCECLCQMDANETCVFLTQLGNVRCDGLDNDYFHYFEQVR